MSFQISVSAASRLARACCHCSGVGGAPAWGCKTNCQWAEASSWERLTPNTSTRIAESSWKPGGSSGCNRERTRPGSTCSVNSKSSHSPLPSTPKGSGRASCRRGRGWKPPVKLTGKPERRRARSSIRKVSRWLIKAREPVLAKPMRSRSTRSLAGARWGRAAGMAGGGITTLWPSSGPHTPQLLQPSKEQSGTTVAARARCRSSASQRLSRPESMWSQGRLWWQKVSRSAVSIASTALQAPSSSWR